MIRTGFTSSLQGIRDATLTLASMVDKSVGRSIEVFESWDTELAREIITDDEAINSGRWDVEEDSVLLIARQAPMASDLRELISIIHIATELERIGDYAKVVARTVVEFESRPQVKATPRILRLGKLGREQLSNSMEAYLEHDAGLARRVAKNDERLDRLWASIYRQMVSEMIADPELVEEASALLSIAHNYERMGDRITNICERIVYTATGEFHENVHLSTLESEPRD